MTDDIDRRTYGEDPLLTLARELRLQRQIAALLRYAKRRRVNEPAYHPSHGLQDLSPTPARCRHCGWPMTWHVVTELEISWGAGGSKNHQLDTAALLRVQIPEHLIPKGCNSF